MDQYINQCHKLEWRGREWSGIYTLQVKIIIIRTDLFYIYVTIYHAQLRQFFPFLFFPYPLKDLNTLLVSNKHWFSIPHEMMHDFTPSQIISEKNLLPAFICALLWRGFEKVCVVACSAVMWGFCYPAELPLLVQISWIPSFCSQDLTKALPEIQKYRRERANESPNLSRGYLYSPRNAAINASLSATLSPCCLLPVHPLKVFRQRTSATSDIRSSPASSQRQQNCTIDLTTNGIKYHISLVPAKHPCLSGVCTCTHTGSQQGISQVQDEQPASCGMLSSLCVPAVTADIPACICARHPQTHSHICKLW